MDKGKDSTAYESKEELTGNEIFKTAMLNPTFRELHDVVWGKSTKRFPTPLDEADYVVSLMDGMTRREKVICIALKKGWEEQLAHQNPLGMGSADDLLRGMEMMSSLPPVLAELLMEGMPAELWDRGVRVRVVSLGDALDDFMKPSHSGCKDPECSCGGCTC